MGFLGYLPAIGMTAAGAATANPYLIGAGVGMGAKQYEGQEQDKERDRQIEMARIRGTYAPLTGEKAGFENIRGPSNFIGGQLQGGVQGALIGGAIGNGLSGGGAAGTEAIPQHTNAQGQLVSGYDPLAGMQEGSALPYNVGDAGQINPGNDPYSVGGWGQSKINPYAAPNLQSAARPAAQQDPYNVFKARNTPYPSLPYGAS